ETLSLNAWIPLEDCTLEAGAIGYLPGSHRLGKVTMAELERGRNPLQDPAFARLLAPPKFLEPAPGAVVFHHVLAYHLSTANRSDRVRKAFAVTYVADGSTRGTPWPHPSLDRAAI